jgi:hypothetical protein
VETDTVKLPMIPPSGLELLLITDHHSPPAILNHANGSSYARGPAYTFPGSWSAAAVVTRRSCPGANPGALHDPDIPTPGFSLVIPHWPTASSIGSFTTHTASKCVEIQCARIEASPERKAVSALPIEFVNHLMYNPFLMSGASMTIQDDFQQAVLLCFPLACGAAKSVHVTVVDGHGEETKNCGHCGFDGD